jgi:hypothetical protein
MDKKLDIRDKLITGTFDIGSDGRKHPINWEIYALKLEQHLKQVQADSWSEGAIAMCKHLGYYYPAVGPSNPYIETTTQNNG